MHPFYKSRTSRVGLSLLELMSILAIIGILSAVALTTVAPASIEGKRTSCHLHKAEVELQCQHWKNVNGSYPSATLSTIQDDINYFPEGLPTCPVDGSSYTIDSSTGLVVGHEH